MSLILRRARPSDAAAVADQFSDPDVYGGTLQLPYASEEIWQQRLQTTNPPAAGSNELVLAAVVDDKAVGLAGLHPVGASVRRRHAMMLGITVSRTHQGQGVGQALMAALLDYADNWGQILRVELTVFSDNERAIRLYERHGFVHEGRMTAYALRNGEYVDALAMARQHPKPPVLPNR